VNPRRRRRQKWRATVRYWAHVWGSARGRRLPGWIDHITYDIAKRAGGDVAPRFVVEILVGKPIPSRP
jgi:hypothetical protein